MLHIATYLLVFLGILWTSPSAAASNTNLLLFYSNDVHGETDPCG